MNKVAIALAIILYGGAAVYLLTFGIQSTFLTDVLTGQVDFFSAMIFNAMGFFPILFLLEALLLQTHRYRQSWLVLLLAFVLGGFPLIPYFFIERPLKSKVSWKLGTIVLYVMTGLTLGLVGSLILLSFDTVYFTRLTSDAFIAVMTLDAATLAVLSVQRAWAISQEKKIWIFLPFIGYGLAMAQAYASRLIKTNR